MSVCVCVCVCVQLFVAVCVVCVCVNVCCICECLSVYMYKHLTHDTCTLNRAYILICGNPRNNVKPTLSMDARTVSDITNCQFCTLVVSFMHIEGFTTFKVFDM